MEEIRAGRHLAEPLNALEDGKEEENEDERNVWIEEWDYNQLYEWDMLLEEDKIEYEYLSDDD